MRNLNKVTLYVNSFSHAIHSYNGDESGIICQCSWAHECLAVKGFQTLMLEYKLLITPYFPVFLSLVTRATTIDDFATIWFGEALWLYWTSKLRLRFFSFLLLCFLRGQLVFKSFSLYQCWKIKYNKCFSCLCRKPYFGIFLHENYLPVCKRGNVDTRLYQ